MTKRDTHRLCNGDPQEVESSNASSVVGLVSLTSGPYTCSKMAVTSLTEQLCFELEAAGEVSLKFKV